VPDFAKTHVSLSGVLLSAVPGLEPEPAGALTAIVPILPTSQRMFDRGSRVSAFVRLYAGGQDALAPVILHTGIYDEHERAIVDRTETVAAADFDAAARSTDHYDVPLAGLAPGEYVLTFEAEKGKVRSERDVRFAVK
jgi:hypothetical protein